MGLFSSAFIYTLSNGLNAAIPFLLLPVLTRVLHPEEYAVIGMFQAVVSIASIFAGLGLNGAVKVHYFKNAQENFPEYLGTVLIVLAASTLLSVFIVLLFSENISGLTALTGSLIVAAVFVAAMNVLVNIRLVLWQVRFKPVSFGVFRILQTLLNAFISLYLVLVVSMGETGRIYGLVISTLLFGFIGLLTFIRNRDAKFVWKKDYAASCLNFCIPLIPHVAAGIIVAVADRFILGSKIGFLSVGIYFAASQLALPVRILGESLNQAFTPWGYQAMTESQDYKFVAVSYLFMAFIGICAFLYIIFIIFAYDFLLGQHYQDGLGVTIILVIASCFYAFYLIVRKPITYKEKNKYISIISVALGIFFLYLAVKMVDYFGIYGMAWAYLVFQFLMFISIWIFSGRIHPQPWADVPGVIARINTLVKQRISSVIKS